MLIITGIVFLLLSLLSGIALLAAPFGALLGIGGGDGSINWLAFPLFALLGPALFMFSADTARAARICGGAGTMLVLLGLGGLIAVFLAGNGMLTATHTTSLWYVAGVGLAFGSTALGLKSLLDRRQESAGKP